MQKSIRKYITGGIGSVAVTAAIVVVVIALVLLFTADRGSRDSLDSMLRDSFDRMLRFQTETAYTMLEEVHRLEVNGVIDSDAAFDLAVSLLREIRYALDDEDTADGYFWADTSGGVNVVLYGNEAVEGTYRDDLQDVHGTYLIQEIRAAAMAGGGFTDYFFPKLGETEALPKRGYSLYFEPYDLVIGTGAYTDDIDMILDGILQEQVARFTGAVFMLSISGLLGVLVILLLIFRITRNLTQPLQLTVRSLQEAAEGEGDLTRRLPDNSLRELHDLALSFNRFSETLQELILQVKRTTEELTGSGETLAANAEEMSSAVNQMSAGIESVHNLIGTQAGKVDSAVQTVRSMDSHMNNLIGQIEHQAASVSESSASIEEMIGNIQSVAGNVEKNDDNVQKLVSAAREGREKLGIVNTGIRDIVSSSENLLEANRIVASVAAQTNLLAMNAAIEAAHAGDYGAGFSVVADEIRSLATKASEQAKQTGANLKSIKEVIDRVSASSEDAEHSFENMGQLVETVSNLEREIRLAMDEQSAAGKQVLTALTEMNGLMENVRSGAEEIHSGSSSLQNVMEQLSQLSSQVKSSMDEMAVGIGEINSSVTTVSHMSVSNQDIVSSLAEQVQRFKVADAAEGELEFSSDHE